MDKTQQAIFIQKLNYLKSVIYTFGEKSDSA